MPRTRHVIRSSPFTPLFRLTLVVAFVAGLLAAVVPTAAAQDSTPAAGTDGLGVPVTIFNQNVQPIGEVTVLDIVEPFEDYDVAYSEPTRGHHWAKVTVRLKAGDQPVSGGTFQMIDSDGYLNYQEYVTRSSESTTAEPDFYASDVQPGQETTGVVFFKVFDESSIALIEFNPSTGSGQQTVVAADLRESNATQGDVVSFTSGSGAPVADVSVVGVLDPLEDFDPNSAPQRGFRFVGVAVSITNTGTRPLQTDPSRFSLYDREGFFYYSYGAYRTPEGEAAFPSLQYGEVAPGATVQGIVTFELINGAVPAEIAFTPNSNRKFRLAEFAEGEPLTPPTLADVPTPTPQPTPDPACAEVETWLASADALFEPATAVFALVDQVDNDQTVDPQALRDGADQIRDLSGQLDDLDTPEIAGGVNEQYKQIFTQLADGIDALADAVEGGDAATIQAAIDALYGVFTSVEQGAIAELAARCPDANL